MSNSQNEVSEQAGEGTQEPALSLQDLLEAGSEVLKRVGRDYGTERAMAGHYSLSTGHWMGSTPTAHSMSKLERPLDD